MIKERSTTNPPNATLRALIDLRDDREVSAREGDLLTIGRGSCDLRLPNRMVSRHHATILVGPGFVTVTCTSTTHPLWIDDGDETPRHVAYGRTVVVDCPGAVIQMRLRPHNTLAPDLDLFGAPAVRIGLDPDWDTTRHPAPRSARSLIEDEHEAPTLKVISDLRSRTAFLSLVALCAPMYEPSASRSRPPTNREIADQLASIGIRRAPETIRNDLSGSRSRLGLEFSQDGQRVSRLALMAMAVQTGVVTAADVERLRDGSLLPNS